MNGNKVTETATMSSTQPSDGSKPAGGTVHSPQSGDVASTQVTEHHKQSTPDKEADQMQHSSSPHPEGGPPAKKTLIGRFAY